MKTWVKKISTPKLARRSRFTLAGHQLIPLADHDAVDAIHDDQVVARERRVDYGDRQFPPGQPKRPQV